MLDTTIDLINRVGKKIGLDNSQIEKFLEADEIHEFEVKLGKKNYKAYRAQHNSKLGPYKGGVRFHPQVDRSEVHALSILMSLKTAAVGLPLGGGKGGISIDPRQLKEKEKEEISRQYVRALYKNIGPSKDVPAPDVNTDSEIMDHMADEYSKLTGDKTKASFTGKSLKNDGSQGRTAATGRGGVYCLEEFLRLSDKNNQPITIAIQGAGNVGQYFLLDAAKRPNWKIIAFSDSSATVYCPSGLDVKEVVGFKRKKPLSAYSGEKVQIEPEGSIISKSVDVLVLAALENSITEENANQVKAKIILELANGPISKNAETILKEKEIIPDIIANSGGVIASYLEWQQNLSNQSWSEGRVNKFIKSKITNATSIMYKRSKESGLSYKESATATAIERLL